MLVEEKGMLVNIAKDLNAFVPNEHISDLGERQGKAKYKVGSSVSGRILAVNAARKRASMTLKKALVNSKVKPLAAWEVSHYFSQGILKWPSAYPCQH